MPTSEDLVPRGLPHGERQRQVAAMRQAQLPLSSESAQAQPTLRLLDTLGSNPAARATQPTRRDFDALLETDPDDIRGLVDPNSDFALSTQMTPFTPEQIDRRLEGVAAASNNQFMRAVAQRIRLIRDR